MLNVPQKPPRRIEVFCGPDDKWRWRLVANRTSKVLAVGEDTFDEKEGAQRAARTEASFYAGCYITVVTIAKGAPQSCPTPTA
jgi:hypothetical protein